MGISTSPTFFDVEKWQKIQRNTDAKKSVTLGIFWSHDSTGKKMTVLDAVSWFL